MMQHNMAKFQELSREEQHDYLALCTRIGHIRRLARKNGVDPDDVIYTGRVNGVLYVFPGKLLLENPLVEKEKKNADIQAKVDKISGSPY